VTYPSTGGRREGLQVRLPMEEGTRRRHQHLFDENVEKIGMRGLRTLIVKGSGIVFTHGDSIKCANMTSKLHIFPFLCFYVFSLFMFFSFYGSFVFFYLFVVDKRVSLAPTYSQL